LEPPHATGEDDRPVKVSWLKQRRLVGPIVKDRWRPHTLAAIAINGGDVRAINPIVLEQF